MKANMSHRRFLSHPFTRPFDRVIGEKRKKGIKHPLYRYWLRLKQTLYNVNYNSYYLYGGEGVKMCDEWKNNFVSFLLWSINNGYEEGLVLARKNKRKDFQPSNCVFLVKNQHETE